MGLGDEKMKKTFVFIVFIVFLVTFGFSYVYSRGNNVIRSGEEIEFVGFNETQVFMKVYKIDYPIDVIVNHRTLEEAEKTFLFSKTIRSNSNGEISEKFVLKDLGLYFFEFQGNQDKSFEEVLVTDTDFIFTYDGEKLYIKVYDLKTLNEVDSRIILQDANDKTINYNNVSELTCEISNLEKIVVQNKFGIRYQSIYRKFELYKDNPIQIIIDRPLYKPDQMVNFRIISYKQEDSTYVFENNQEINIDILDPVGNKIYTETYTSDEFGGANGQYYISKSAPLGYYRIDLYKQNEEKYTYGFYVQEYVKPEYTANITTPKEKYFTDEVIDYQLKLEYLNGIPVKNAQVSLYVYYDAYFGYEGRSLLYQAITYSNENGILDIPIKVQDGHEGYYTLEVVIVDESQRQMQEVCQVRVMDGSYMINLENRYFQSEPNENLTFEGTVTDREDILQNGQMKVTVYKKIWDQKALKTVNEAIDEFNIYVENGYFNFIYTFSEEANYWIELSFKDSTADLNVYVSPYVKTTQSTFSKFQIEDDKVVFAIETNLKTNGLIFLAGRNIYEVIEYDQNKKEYVFTIPQNLLERNIFVYAVLLTQKGTEILQESIDLGKIEKLTYEYKINTNKEVYKPKEEVRISIEASEDGIFTLGVVDEGIYQLVEDRKNIINELYPEMYYIESTISTGNAYLYLPYKYYGMSLEESQVFGAYKGSSELSTNTREYFPDTALWVPFLKTQDKKVEIVFTNPDSLTTWRITSNGFSRDGIKMKKETVSFKSNLDFYIRPLLPNFAVEGDNAEFYLVVYNNVSETKQIKYNISINNEKIQITPNEGEIEILPNSQEIIKLKLSAFENGETEITFDFAYDIVKLPFIVRDDQIIRDVVKLVDTTQGYTIKKGQEFRPFDLNILTNDLLDYIKNYPYSCSEQTVSTIYPLLTAQSLGYEIEDIDLKIINSLQSLYKSQKDDGGWGWWSNSEKSDPEMSAYVMFGLKKIEDSGYYVSQGTISKGLSYLKKNVVSGFVYYVLRLYGIDISYEPEDILDEIYYTFFNKDNLETVLSKIVEKEDIAYVDYFDEDYFCSVTEVNAVLLDLLLEEVPHASITLKVFKYLISNREGYSWYSTKESAKMLDILLKYKNNFSIYSTAKYLNEKNEFIVSQNDVYLYDQGLYEIKEENVIEPSINNSGITLDKLLYKKYDVTGKKGNNNYMLDAFISIEESKIPVSLESVEESNILEKDEQLIWYNTFVSQSIYEDEEITIRYKRLENQIHINDYIIEKPKMLIKNSDWVYAINNEILYKYNINQASIKGFIVNGSIKSLALLDNMPILLIENEETKENYLYINQGYEKLPNSFNSVDILNNQIILFSDVMYWYDIENHKLNRLFPISAYKVSQISDNSIEIFGNVKFEGNSRNVGPLGLYKIVFENNQNTYFQEGDIVKVKIKMKSDIPSFLVTEDYLPGNIQILRNYSERNISQSTKFYYNWYSPWNYWYSGMEIRTEKIAFFSGGYKQGEYEYYFRLLNSGTYKILPAISYTMYWKGTFGSSYEILLNVK